MGWSNLSQTVEQAMQDCNRRILLLLERMGKRFAQRGITVDHVFTNGDPAQEILCAAARPLLDVGRQADVSLKERADGLG